MKTVKRAEAVTAAAFFRQVVYKKFTCGWQNGTI